MHTGFYFRKIGEVYRALQMAVYVGETHVDMDEVYRSGAFYLPMEFRENHAVMPSLLFRGEGKN